MAKLIAQSLILLSSLLMISIIPSSDARKHQVIDIDAAADDSWFQDHHLLHGGEKVAKIHVYVQDVLGGPSPTVYQVAEASITENSATGFGQVRVLDDKLTNGTGEYSTEVGRLQGLITYADLSVSALAMNVNFYFTAGKANGSSLCILGRNQMMNAEREYPVVGGTGIFRYTRGYTLSSTYSYDVEAEHGVLEYTFYVTYDLENSPVLTTTGPRPATDM